MSLFHPVQWLAFDPRGLVVRGAHQPGAMPVHLRYEKGFDAVWADVRERVLRAPGGFDGQRAALVHWELEPARGTRPACLSLETGFRSYSQGTALKHLIARDGHWDAEVLASIADLPQPQPGLSWGSSLTSVVLLPNGKVLAGQRSSHLQASPGVWSCAFTEILEPDDVSAWNMDDLLERLVRDELPLLAGKGTHRFVGLMLLPRSYTWSLVSVLDLRAQPAHEMDALLAQMVPDEETQAWASLPLHSMPGLACADATESGPVQGLELAQDLAARL